MKEKRDVALLVGPSRVHPHLHKLKKKLSEVNKDSSSTLPSPPPQLTSNSMAETMAITFSKFHYLFPRVLPIPDKHV